MAFNIDVRRTTGVVCATLFLASISATRAAESVILRLGIATTFTTAGDFKTAVPGDTKVVEIFPLTDRKVILQPLAVGATNILFLDTKGEEVANVSVRVDQSVHEEGGATRIQVHNVPGKIGSATAYRCGNLGCDYLEDVNIKPAPVTGANPDHGVEGVQTAPATK